MTRRYPPSPPARHQSGIVHDARSGRSRRAALAAIAALAAAAAGCAGLGWREPVSVNVVGLDPIPGEGMETRLALKLRVQNPNEQPIEFDGVSVRLDLGGARIATGVSDQRGTVPRFGETVITVPMSVSILGMLRQAVGIATGERQRADYALSGRLASPGFGGLRFESQGELKLPAGMLEPGR